jgi:hypothetical protein
VEVADAMINQEAIDALATLVVTDVLQALEVEVIDDLVIDDLVIKARVTAR